MKVNVVASADVLVPSHVSGQPISVPAPIPLPRRGSPIVYRAKLLGCRGATPLHPNQQGRFAADLQRLKRRGNRHVRAVVLRADFDEASLTKIVEALKASGVQRLDLTVKD